MIEIAVALFRDKVHYDRKATLEAAETYRTRGKRKKAIAEYRKILQHEPESTQVHAKLAPLLAETKQMDEAWKSFVAAAEGFRKQGFDEKAIAVYQQAARYLPQEVELWETIARMKAAKGKGPDAQKTLLDATVHFRGKRLRPLAVRLLRLGFEIEPWEFKTTFALAGLLAKTGERGEARRFYEGLVERTRRKKLRKVRAALFRLSPTPAAAWRWARAALRGT